jgi:hypothetical protein
MRGVRMEDIKKQRLFIRSEIVTDNVWWYCGGPTLSDALKGVSNYLAAHESAPDDPHELQLFIDDFELDVRMMTDAEVAAIPDV